VWPNEEAFRSRRKGCRCESCHADQFGMSTGQANRASVLTSACLRASGASPRHFHHSCARSSKRAGGFIPRIALDQCRDPERYRTRVPFTVIKQEATEPTEQEEWPSPFPPFASVKSTAVVSRQHRSRASAQVGFISPLCPGQHRRLRPFSASTQQPADFFCKEFLPEHHRLEAPFRLLA
jgi:hypothetical protein